MSILRPLLVAALLAVLPGLARAQAPPSRGVALPAASVADVADATAVSVNPAGLLRLTGWGLAYQYSGLRFADRRGVPAGHGLWLGLPLGRSVALGIGHERRGGAVLPEEFSAEQADLHRTTLSMAAGRKRLSVGANWHLVAASDDELETFSTWEAGLQAAPWRWLAVGARVEDLAGPDVEDRDGTVPLGRQWELGLAVRPGTERVTLGGTLAAAEPTEGGDLLALSRAGGFLELVPLEGLRARVGAWVDADGHPAGSVLLGLDFARAGVTAGMFAGQGDDDRLVADGTALSLRLSGDHYAPLVRGKPKLAEVRLADSLPELRRPLLPFLPAGGPTFKGVLRLLERVRDDPDVGGVLLRIDRLRLNLPQAQELRAALDAIKGAGKKVLVHLTEPDHRVYLAVAGADELRIHPVSGLYLIGIRVSFSYYAKTLERLGIRGDFVAIGKYKSSPDAFTRDSMGEAQREAETALLDSVYADVVGAIASGRGKTEEQVRAWIEDGPYEAGRAVEAGLVDGTAHYEDWKKELSESGKRFIKRLGARTRRRPRWSPLPRIAVVHVDGAITGGEGRQSPFWGRSAGARSITRALDAARKDGSVKAVVLRIDSPGGSATASETIHRAASRLAEDKPVVASLANVAASGGYYVAAAAHHVVADPATVTGSIGIFAGKFDLAGLWKLLSLNKETLKRGSRADILSFDRGFTEEERKAIEANLRAGYEMFLRRVAEGRKLERDRVHEVAQGRIWSGRQAQAQGLVDTVGGFSEALAEAKRRAGLEEDEEVRVVTFTGAKGGLPGLSGAVGGVVDDAVGRALPRPDPATARALGVLWPLLAGAFKNGEPLFLVDPLVQVE